MLQSCAPAADAPASDPAGDPVSAPVVAGGGVGPGVGSAATAAVPSALTARLATGRPEVLEAFRRARRTVLAGERLDVGALAAGLGVDRTSLFRWLGSRDALLAEVLWSVAAPTLDGCELAADAAGLRGTERVAAVLEGFVAAMVSAAFFQQLLRREPARCLRLLTTTASPVSARFTAAVEALLDEGAAAGELVAVLPVHDLAWLLVRVAESFTYAGPVAGEAPDAGRAASALRLLLRAGTAPR